MGDNFLPMAHSPKSLLWFIYIRIHPEFKQSWGHPLDKKHLLKVLQVALAA